MLNPNLSKNRDVRRINPASKAIQGTIFSSIGTSSLTMLQDMFHDRDTNMQSVNKDRVTDLLRVAKESNEELLKLYSQSNKDINTTHCKQYAMKHANAMKMAIMNNEDIDSIPNISNHIVNEKMLSLSRIVYDTNVNTQSANSWSK